MGYVNARDDESLKVLAAELLPTLRAKREALNKLIHGNETAAIGVSKKTQTFWEMKRVASDGILSVLQDGDKPTYELDSEARQRREAFIKAVNVAWDGLRSVLLQVHQDVIGPYLLGEEILDSISSNPDLFSHTGDQLSIADIHLAAWLARVAKLSGATATDDGNTAIAKIEAHVGGDFELPKDFSIVEARRRAGLPPANVLPEDRQNRFAAFWDAIKERPSWKKVYAEGLH